MRILVSACLLGENCKYNGGNNRSEALLRRLQGHEVLPVCPEVLSGLGVPRPCVELRDGVAYNQYGENVDAAFRAGVEKALAQIEGQADRPGGAAIPQPHLRRQTDLRRHLLPPSHPGQGMLAAALTARGYRVVDVEDIATVPEL